MLVDIRIKMRQPMLGKNRDSDGIRRFAKTDADEVALDSDVWYWLLSQASKSLEFNIDCYRVRPPLGIRPGQLIMLRRTSNTPSRKDVFEAIPKGAELTFQTAIIEEDDAPSLEQLQEMMDFIGKYLGISQWGSKFNYGRFKVIFVKQHRRDEQQSPTKVDRQ